MTTAFGWHLIFCFGRSIAAVVSHRMVYRSSYAEDPWPRSNRLPDFAPWRATWRCKPIMVSMSWPVSGARTASTALAVHAKYPAISAATKSMNNRARSGVFGRKRGGNKAALKLSLRQKSQVPELISASTVSAGGKRCQHH
jgi:hypothetical protein